MPHPCSPLPWRVFPLVGIVVVLLADGASAQTPLHRRIDQAITASWQGPDKWTAAPASDAEFLRRVCLDLTGTIPTAAEARAFLGDSSPNKRQQLIDRLLASAEYARHMQNVFDVMLMERRPDKHVPRAQWQEYLRTSFAANKPLDQLAREILSADGSDPKLRPAAKFFLDREGEPHLITRDLGRVFLGMNLECCQCHDHPVVPPYKQADYYGLFAFLNRSFLFTGKGRNQAIYAEKGEGEVSFQSAFDPKKTNKTTGPRLVGGAVLKEPAFEKGKEYQVAPANGVQPIPRFSRRGQLAPLLTNPEIPQFRRNLANRLWAMMMGRGLTHPVDWNHDNNPPSHPELLAMLGDELAATKFDTRAFLRELALSQTYQRSSEGPADGKEIPEEKFALGRLKPLSPEQLAMAMLQATGVADAERTALGKTLTETTLQAKLAGNLNTIAGTFASRPGEPPDRNFEATLDQTLFVTNGNLVRTWLAPSPGGNLMGRLVKLAEADAVAEELYLSILTRKPSDEERKELAEYLKNRPQDRTAALQDLAWAFLASAEFRFNH